MHPPTCTRPHAATATCHPGAGTGAHLRLGVAAEEQGAPPQQREQVAGREREDLREPPLQVLLHDAPLPPAPALPVPVHAKAAELCYLAEGAPADSSTPCMQRPGRGNFHAEARMGTQAGAHGTLRQVEEAMRCSLTQAGMVRPPLTAGVLPGRWSGSACIPGRRSRHRTGTAAAPSEWPARRPGGCQHPAAGARRHHRQARQAHILSYAVSPMFEGLMSVRPRLWGVFSCRHGLATGGKRHADVRAFVCQQT